ncbi:liver carboxylesterase 1-like [Loxodonta africana]|uniref:liver carboxylesterase 1-like n=1 Tax=Loxodonta africana TaxID=9785 RepID=UPI0030D36313
MVWIHGGGLMVGGASMYDGLALSAHEDVVVVTIQYRLGIWGFFSTGDEHSPGNWGLWDQVAALHWVQENIADFGGNPGSVTIFGESAGGASVSVLVLSPLAKNLFHRAISESGVTLSIGLVKNESRSAAEKFAILAGCKSTTSAVMVHCLRQKTEEELLETSLKMVGAFILVATQVPPFKLGPRLYHFSCHLYLKNLPEQFLFSREQRFADRLNVGVRKRGVPLSLFVYFNLSKAMHIAHTAQPRAPALGSSNYVVLTEAEVVHPLSTTDCAQLWSHYSVLFQSYPFLPIVVDGMLLPKTPEEIMAEKKFNTVPYIVGINKQEFGWIIPKLMGYPLSEGKLDQKTAASLLWKSYPLVAIPEELTPVITEKYLDGTDDPVKKKDLFLDMLGDAAFGVPSVIVARRHRDAGGPTYMYEFQHRPSFSPEMKPKTVIGDHGDELFSVFGTPFLKESGTEEEVKLSNMVMKLWANFARNGDPNGEGLPHWPAYDQKEGYLEIGTTTKAAQKLKDKEVGFWTEILAKKGAEQPAQTEHIEL